MTNDVMIERDPWASRNPGEVVAEFRAERRYAKAVRRMLEHLRVCCRERMRVVVDLRDGSMCAGYVARVTDDSFFFENGDECELLAIAELEYQP